MTEYIKREDAIEALGEEPYVWSDTDAEIAEHAQWVSDVKAIEAVPSDDVRPVVRGKWINPRPDSEMCSACGVRFSISSLFAVGSNEEPNFCPNCGADMRGETNEI